MKLPGKNPGYGNRGKTNCVFPPFPQPLLLVTNQDEKQLTLKQKIVYTKYLTLPNARPPVGMRQRCCEMIAVTLREVCSSPHGITPEIDCFGMNLERYLVAGEPGAVVTFSMMRSRMTWSEAIKLLRSLSSI